MRGQCFIGCKQVAPSVRWLVNRRYHYQWVAAGGRALRDADPIKDGHTDRWCPVSQARRSITQSQATTATGAAPTLDASVVVEPARKRGRPRKAV